MPEKWIGKHQKNDFLRQQSTRAVTKTAMTTQPSKKPKSILFICTSNVCRGPMAAALLKRRNLTECGRIVQSAGISGTDGRPVLAVAQEVVHKRGMDLSQHHARIVTPNLLPGFDLILAMETRHREWIEQNVLAAKDRTYLLGHWRNLEIRRPVNGDHPDYERIADHIDRCLSDWVTWLRAISNANDKDIQTSAVSNAAN